MKFPTVVMSSNLTFQNKISLQSLVFLIFNFKVFNICNSQNQLCLPELESEEAFSEMLHLNTKCFKAWHSLLSVIKNIS